MGKLGTMMHNGPSGAGFGIGDEGGLGNKVLVRFGRRGQQTGEFMGTKLIQR